MKFSVVIPARNEERHIVHCLEAIACAAKPYPGDVETIVVLNRCTDSTESAAQAHGARIIRDDHRNLAQIRNAGARVATGDVLVTVDADSVMAPATLVEIDRLLASGRYIGGGALIHPERRSAGILLTGLLLVLFAAPRGISAGLFWCRRSDFEALGGFNEEWTTAEDVDFAVRLKALGRKRNLRYGTLWRAPMKTSCRKFDQFGDWFIVRLVLRHPVRMWRAWRGRAPDLGEKYWYDAGLRR